MAVLTSNFCYGFSTIIDTFSLKIVSLRSVTNSLTLHYIVPLMKGHLSCKTTTSKNQRVVSEKVDYCIWKSCRRS